MHNFPVQTVVHQPMSTSSASKSETIVKTEKVKTGKKRKSSKKSGNGESKRGEKVRQIQEIDPYRFCPNPECEQDRPLVVIADESAEFGYSIVDRCAYCGDTRPLPQDQCFSLPQ